MAKDIIKTLKNISKEAIMVRNDEGVKVEIKPNETIESKKWYWLSTAYKSHFKVVEKEEKKEVVKEAKEEKKTTKKSK